MGMILYGNNRRFELDWTEFELYEQERNRVRLDAMEHWRVNLDHLTIEHALRPQYIIPLARCRDSAAILEWIFHLRERFWMTEQAQDELLWLFELLLDPQSNLCSFEQAKSIAENDLRALVLSNFKSGTALPIESGTLPFQRQ